MRNIQLDDFTKYKFLSSLELSPKGDKAGFAVTSCNLDDNSYSSNLWVYDLKDKKSYQLTAMNGERNYIWLKDNETIVFQAVRERKDKDALKNGEEFSQFYQINIHGGEAVKAFKINMNVNSIYEINDDLFIFTATHKAGEKKYFELSDEERKEYLEAKKDDKDYEVLDEIPFWSNGSGFTNKLRSGLYKYHVKENLIEPITEEFSSVMGIEVNEEKNLIALVSSSYKDMAPLNDELYIYDLNGGNLTLVSSKEEFSYGHVKFIGENSLLVSGTDRKDYGINEDGKFYLIDLNSKERKLLTSDFDNSLWNSVGSDCRYGGGKNSVKDGQYLYFITTERDSSYLNRIDIEGNVERVDEVKGSIDCFDVKNGNIITIAMREQKLQELYLIKDGKEEQVTNFNTWIQEEFKVIKPELVLVESDKGVTIEGWVLKPADYVPGKKYPAILDIHGGPKTVYGEVFYHEMQLWANMGYFVFFCNPRGSDGRGRAFADIRGKYGTIDYDDLMKFTDEVLKTYGDIDEERVGVTGGSYGGFMTNWIIGHTNRFKAAASQRSISNWISKFCTTDIGYYFVEDQNSGTPWSDVDKLWFHSPLKYADKVTTPTLFIHSEEDYRCWLAEGLQMFTALKYHGVESRLCMFRGENHELSRSGKPKHRIRRLTEITNWFESHLK